MPSTNERVIANLLAQVGEQKAVKQRLKSAETSGQRVLIIGAGMGGLATALVLHRAGYDVCVFERSVVPGEVGAGINITPAGDASVPSGY
jgi:NADPH-dependent glutamate synthase beta subunit-like oxidoreductase